MFSEPIEIWDATIAAINHKVTDGVMASRILVSGTLNPALAKELEIKTLVFLPNDAPKDGFTKLELSTGCQAFRAVFEADPALKQSFEINGDSTNNYVVERQAEGVLRLKLRLNYHGDPHQALAFVLAVGSGASMLKIVPLQRELDAAQESEVSVKVKHADGTVHETPVPKETVRATLAASQRHSRKQTPGTRKARARK
jgi:hypothetical protein